MHYSHFFAYLFRLKLINRWPLMRNVRTENVAEHSLQVGFVTHLLAVIENRLFDGQHQAAEIALLAIYHDASEALTGDLPTPIKYYNPQIADEYNKIERLAQQKLLALLPEALHADFKPLLVSGQCTAEQHRLIKQADVVCAYLKCLEELVAGNHEFKAAEAVLQKKLADHQSPALDYFMRCFVPSFTLPPEEFSKHEQL